ncbi:Integrase, catalytic core domain-containing protein [Rozella allomycis CSF55]|uniref:Integrase, catalytic core domain-containing protein n=1 Tax=Rozella allomycis (strain CSF55) TaxID=988480 RepID=A0A075ANF8_ROZAC|nr:Integrase, catalytic core domain-containing protein [Rozella allomycis CSF55]|eukprot:EPZ31395.1 Integrase, catalytic core domain-containing protein [Rozella allomycis CSF55]
MVKPQYSFDGRSSISGLFHVWQFDYLGPFPVSENGNRYVLNFVEVLSGYPFAKAVSDTTAITAITCLKELCSLFGVPGKIISDCDKGFTSSYFRETCEKMGIKVEFIPAYQPEWVGFVEGWNRTCRYGITKSVESYRARVHSRTGKSPHYLLFGVEARLPIINKDDEILEGNVELRKAEIENSNRESRSSSIVPQFEVGSFVLVLNSKIRKGHIWDKKKPRYDGPYRIIKKLEKNVYLVINEFGKEKCRVLRGGRVRGRC